MDGMTSSKSISSTCTVSCCSEYVGLSGECSSIDADRAPTDGRRRLGIESLLRREVGVGEVTERRPNDSIDARGLIVGP